MPAVSTPARDRRPSRPGAHSLPSPRTRPVGARSRRFVALLCLAIVASVLSPATGGRSSFSGALFPGALFPGAPPAGAQDAPPDSPAPTVTTPESSPSTPPTSSATGGSPPAEGPGGTGPKSTAPATVPYEEPTPIALPRAAVPVTDDPRVAPQLAWLGVDSPEYRQAISSYQSTEAQLKDGAARELDGTRRYDAAVAELAQLAQVRPAVAGNMTAATRRLAKAQNALADAQVNVHRIAVGLYVNGGVDQSPVAMLDLQHVDDIASRRVFVDSAERHHFALIAEATRVSDEQGALIDTLQAQLDEIDRRAADATTARDTAARDRDRAVADQVRFRADLETKKKGVADARLAAKIEGIDFPFVVLNAYVKAANTMAKESPACRVRWSALAGIGKTESSHGTFNDSKVDAEGNVSPPIYGPKLDGSGGFATVADTDGGALDDDPGGDRAVGPMQFIPGTWKRWAQDGNDDQKIDPQNMYDAALAAAIYICLRGPGLDTDAGLQRGFFSYNADQSYVAVVLGRAHHYDRYTLPTA